MKPMDKYRKYLTDHGYKTTKQRDIIAEEFFKVSGHITIEDLSQKVRSKDSSIGTATVYRTINLLKEAGLAAERQFHDTTPLYEVHLDEEHHDHLICTSCGKIIEFENVEIEQLQEKVAENYGFTLTDHRMELYGKCSNCRK